jgi:toxin FitB
VNYLLDTNVVSEWIKPRPDALVDRWMRETEEDSLWISVVTFAELRQGIEIMGPGLRRTALEGWLENELPARFEGRIAGVDRPVANAWGVLRARSLKSGHAMEGMDAFLAAIAQVRGLTLVTRNTKDFERAGIDLFNPWLATHQRGE